VQEDWRDCFTRQQIVARGFFNEHCTYVLGQPIATPPTAEDVEATMVENTRMRAQAKAEGKKLLAKGQAKVASVQRVLDLRALPFGSTWCLDLLALRFGSVAATTIVLWRRPCGSCLGIA
jgi:hypothetical protein